MNDVDKDRMIAYIIDFIIIDGLFFVVMFLLSIPLSIITFFLPILGYILPLVTLVVFLGLSVMYFHILDTREGTFGHRLMKLKSTANTAPVGKRIIRTLMKSILLVPLIVLIVKLASDRWVHDEISGITVERK